MMTNLLLDITSATIDWSRAQFALTAIYHWLFVPLTLGLAVIMGIAETCYYRTNKPFWKHVTRFWQKLFGINFAMGVATGIILEFEFGTNWSNYSWFVGDVFGAPLAIEGILAFFMESTFVAVMFFGWDKVSRGFNPDTMRFEMISFLDVALSPFAINKFTHTVTSSWIIGATFVVAVSCWYLLKKRETQLAKASIKMGAGVGLIATLLAAMTGDNSAYRVAQVQPMKLAAMEALYNGGKGESLTAIAAVHPFRQPDYENEQEPAMRIAIPNMLSFLATRTAYGYVPGVNDILKGYTKEDGTREPSVQEKIARGKKAIVALKTYRETKAKDQLPILRENMKYFGYGYIKDAKELVPSIPICFYAFRLMVGVGCLLILFFALSLFLVYKKEIAQYRWFLISAIIMIPLAYIASESGWIVAEIGRQPWTIQDLLPVSAAISDIEAGSVATTFFIFLVLFTTMLAVEISILVKQIKKGPEYD